MDCARVGEGGVRVVASQRVARRARPGREELRHNAARRRAVRSSLTLFALHTVGISLAVLVAFPAFYGETSPSVTALEVAQAACAGIAFILARGPLRRHPQPVAFALGLAVVTVSLSVFASAPETHVIVGVGLAVAIVAVALFFPWSELTHRLWLSACAVLAGVFALSPVAPAALGFEHRRDVFVGIAFAIAVSAMAQPVIERSRRRAFSQEQRLRAVVRTRRQQESVLERLVRELAETARNDALTGVGNRLRFDEDLATARARLQRYGQGFALILIDVDHFKAYNDCYGHVAGDTALRQLAACLREKSRAGDAVYRIGGEEFMVLLPDQSPQAARVAAERLRQAVAGLAVQHAGNSPWGVVTVSLGVTAAQPGDGRSVDAWLRDADARLYAAKRAGRNRVAVARPASGSTSRVGGQSAMP